MSESTHNKVTRRKFVTGVAGGSALLPAGPARATQKTPSPPENSVIGYPRVFTGENLQLIAFPLGGIGTGTISLGGRGQLKDWEIFNRPDKGNTPDYGFFAIRAAVGAREADSRVLEARLQPPYHVKGLYRGLSFYNAPGLPRFREARFEGDYPFARIDFLDDEFPVKVHLEAFNPLVPLDTEASGLPVAILRYTVSNPASESAAVSIAYSQENPVGKKGHRCDPRQEELLNGLMFTDPFVGSDDPLRGSFAVAVLPETGMHYSYMSRWKGTFPRDWVLHFWNTFKRDGRLLETREQSPSREGSVCVEMRIPARQSVALTFLLTWHFPNRTPARCGWRAPKGHENDVIGNHYCVRFQDAWAAAKYVAENLESLEKRTRAFVLAIRQSTVSAAVLDAAMSNVSTLRTNTCFQTSDGNFYGFEGCMDNAGCCFGNCTHVWNYEQATGFLFPTLARNMREGEFGPALDEQGCMSVRQTLPANIERVALAAADGQMGTLMRLYREWQLSGDTDWLLKIWPAARRAMSFAWMENGWDSDQDGVIEGVQLNTYDVEFFGPNPLCTVIYLGALRACEEMARSAGDGLFADRCRSLFERGREWVDTNLFQGQYYIQQVRPVAVDRIPKSLAIAGAVRHRPENPVHQVGDGCLIDQLLGQCIAHAVGLGYLLKEEKVKTALKSIVRHNFRQSLEKHESVQRVFALNDEAAVLMCSYPKGEPPEFPFWFYQEVWTGSEYQLAAHLFFEGLFEEGLKVVESVRRRYDGYRRNPWNEVECGHHYARAMASWALIAALSGFHFSGVKKSIAFHPRCNQEAFHTFWSTGTAWGRFSQQKSSSGFHAGLEISEGSLALREFGVDVDKVRGGTEVHVTIDGDVVQTSLEISGSGARLAFGRPLHLQGGQRLEIAIS